MGNLGQSENTPELATDERDPFEALAEEFIARRRKGETPNLDEFVARLPERAEEIRELFPAIAAMERWKPRPGTPRQRLGGGPVRERIGEYRLIREIGRGGMGIVYEAEQPSLGRRVAIKVLPGTGWADDRPMQRFLREAKTTASLKHGNIVPVYAVGQEEDLHYYVMPLIVGAGLDKVILELRERKIASFDGNETFDEDILGVARTLLERTNGGTPTLSRGAKTEPFDSPLSLIVLEPTGRLTDHPLRRGPARNSENRHWQGIAGIGRQVADALQHAHDAGVLHRDIKPANLLLDADGMIWVADFGLAKAMSHDDLSRTGDLVGTLRYMAPERFRGVCDGRSDLYSLGLTLYELMTLRPAHDVTDRTELIRKIAEADPIRPREIDPSIPLDLETVILKSLESDPNRRYASADEMAADLGRFADGLPVLARRAGIVERVARWMGQNRVLAALGLLSIVLGLFGGYFFKLWYYAPPRPIRAERPFGPARRAEPPPVDQSDGPSLEELLHPPPRRPPGGPGFDGPPPHPPDGRFAGRGGRGFGPGPGDSPPPPGDGRPFRPRRPPPPPPE
jgi:eukaryotic-like serine/threonine-protein kinase